MPSMQSGDTNLIGYLKMSDAFGESRGPGSGEEKLKDALELSHKFQRIVG
jgi:hypothetical protein